MVIGALSYAIRPHPPEADRRPRPAVLYARMPAVLSTRMKVLYARMKPARANEAPRYSDTLGRECRVVKARPQS